MSKSPTQTDTITIDGVKLKLAYKDPLKSINPALWQPRYPWDVAKNLLGPNGKGGRINGEEVQIYTIPSLGDPPAATSGDNGLALKAWPFTDAEKADCLKRMRDAGNTTTTEGYWGYDFGSGILAGFKDGATTFGVDCLSFTYGYLTCKMKCEETKGAWPAVWSAKVKDFTPDPHLPPDHGKAEFDACEIIGGDPKRALYQTVHWNDKATAGEPFRVKTEDFDGTVWHEYGFLWTPDFISLFLDGHRTGRTDNRDIHDPQYPVLNLAMGGQWPNDIGCTPEPDAHACAKFKDFKLYSIVP